MTCVYASHASISVTIVTFLLLSQWPSTTSQKAKTCPYPSLLITKACKGTASFSDLEHECIESLTMNHRTASATTALELVAAALSIALEKAKHTMALIGSPEKPCFKSCAEHYNDAIVDGLQKAWLEMKKRNVDETDDELSRARDAADYCNMVLSVDPDDTRSPVFKANKDVHDHITFVMSAADLLLSN